MRLVIEPEAATRQAPLYALATLAALPMATLALERCQNDGRLLVLVEADGYCCHEHLDSLGEA